MNRRSLTAILLVLGVGLAWIALQQRLDGRRVSGVLRFRDASSPEGLGIRIMGPHRSLPSQIRYSPRAELSDHDRQREFSSLMSAIAAPSGAFSFVLPQGEWNTLEVWSVDRGLIDVLPFPVSRKNGAVDLGVIALSPWASGLLEVHGDPPESANAILVLKNASIDQVIGEPVALSSVAFPVEMPLYGGIDDLLEMVVYSSEEGWRLQRILGVLGAKRTLLVELPVEWDQSISLQGLSPAIGTRSWIFSCGDWVWWLQESEGAIRGPQPACGDVVWGRCYSSPVAEIIVGQLESDEPGSSRLVVADTAVQFSVEPRAMGDVDSFVISIYALEGSKAYLENLLRKPVASRVASVGETIRVAGLPTGRFVAVIVDTAASSVQGRGGDMLLSDSLLLSVIKVAFDVSAGCREKLVVR